MYLKKWVWVQRSEGSLTSKVNPILTLVPEKVGVGTEVRRFPDRSNSTRFVRPRKAVGSICPKTNKKIDET